MILSRVNDLPVTKAVGAGPAAGPDARGAGYMPQLDALRAFAVIAVVAQHAAPQLKAIFPCAHAGVRLFFVLSGFLITGILLRARDEAEASGRGRWRGLGRFYARRALRIFPLYFLVIALGLAFDVGPIREAIAWLLTYTVNFYIALRQEWVDGYFHLWSLAIEEQFYLAWPLVVLFAPRRWLVPIILAMIAAGVAYRSYAVGHRFHEIATYCLTPACLDSLGMGALLAVAGHRGWIGGFFGRVALPIGLIAIVMLRVLHDAGARSADAIALDLALAVFFAGLVGAAARGLGGRAGAVLGWGPLRYVGKISYGIYVYHVFAPILLLTILKGAARSLGIDEGEGFGAWSFPIVVAIIAVAPVLSWHFVERPINGLKAYFEDGAAGRPPRPPGRAFAPLVRYGAALAVLLAMAGAVAVRGAWNRREYGRRADDRSTIAGTTYYLSPTGDDAAVGTSPAAPWRTLARANRVDLAPGDRLLMEAGASFPGPLHLDAGDAGTPARPIVVGSFGAGRATILAGLGDGIVARNTMGLEIRDLVVVGDGRAVNRGSGIRVETDLAGDVKLDHVRIDRVEARGFGRFGVLVDGNRGKSGYRDLRIAAVEAHENALAGLAVRGEFAPHSRDYAHEEVAIVGCTAHHNPGVPGPSRDHSGSGIVIADVRGGLVEHCRAFENGALCESDEGGPVGIWAWDCDAIAIQHNLSYRNRVAGPKDGGGFDLDGGVTNSVLQYNHSYENDGAGYLLAQFPGARPFRGNTVRYNVSRDDGRRNRYGGIHCWGVMSAVEIHNNTIVATPSDRGGTPGAILWVPWETWTTDFHLRNNVLRVGGGLTLLEVPAGQSGLLFQGNAYYADEGPFRIGWEDTTYESLSAWRLATGQERIGPANVGLDVDPRLGPPAEGCPLAEGSPMIDAGLDLKRLFGVDPGPRDLAGAAVPQGAALDVGAHEFARVRPRPAGDGVGE